MNVSVRAVVALLETIAELRAELARLTTVENEDLVVAREASTAIFEKAVEKNTELAHAREEIKNLRLEVQRLSTIEEQDLESGNEIDELKAQRDRLHKLSLERRREVLATVARLKDALQNLSCTCAKVGICGRCVVAAAVEDLEKKKELLHG